MAGFSKTQSAGQRAILFFKMTERKAKNNVLKRSPSAGLVAMAL
jgi:hypothetical protein